MSEEYGKVIQVVGPIIDVQFRNQHLPELLTALEVQIGDGKKLVVEVAQHIGDDVVRCVSMGRISPRNAGNFNRKTN